MTARSVPYPDLPESHDIAVVRAVHRDLADDPTLAGLGIPVEGYHLVELLRAGSIRAPMVAVILSRTDEDRDGTTTLLRCEIYLGVVTHLPGDRRTDDGYLSRRLIDHCKRVLARRRGVLLSPTGDRLTEALLEWRVSDAAIELPGSSLLLEAVRAVFTARIYEDTREFID